MLLQHRFDALLQRFGRGFGREAEVEVDHHAARNDVAGAGAAVDVADLPAGGRKERVAAIPLDGDQFGKRGRQIVNRVARQVRVGDVPLNPLHRELARESAAAAVLDHVAGAFHAGRFAYDAVVEPFAARLEHVADDNGAIDGRAFLVAGEQEGDVEWCVRLRDDEFLHRDNEGGDRRFHVARAAAVELAVALGGREWIAAPLLERAGGYHIRVARENYGFDSFWRLCRVRCRPFRPQIANAECVRPAVDDLVDKAQRRQARGDHFDAAGVQRRDRGASDELFSKQASGGHVERSAWDVEREGPRCLGIHAHRRTRADHAPPMRESE